MDKAMTTEAAIRRDKPVYMLPPPPLSLSPPYKSSPCIPILGQPLKLSPAIAPPLCFSLQVAAPGISWAAWLWVSGQGLTCDAGYWLLEGVSSSSPTSLGNFIFCWLLLGPFAEFLLLTVSGHRIRRILQRQVLMNVWIFFSPWTASAKFMIIMVVGCYAPTYDAELQRKDLRKTLKY